MYRVFKAPKFEKQSNKIFTKKESEELKRFIKGIKEGKNVGKPLSYEYFQEKKIGGKRIILIYEDISVALLVSASKKKYQQETIDEIKALLPHFKLYAYELSTL